VEKKWYIVDAADKRLGRLASTIAIHIRGKNVPAFTPSIDMGAYVVVVRNLLFFTHVKCLCIFVIIQPSSSQLYTFLGDYLTQGGRLSNGLKMWKFWKM